MDKAPDENWSSPAGGRYRPLRELGRGSFGQVILCEDVELDREVAVKMLTLRDDPEIEARFLREARLTAQLRHSNIVEVYDHGVDPDGVAYIVYEYVPGKDLSAVASDSKHGRLSRSRAREWGCALAEALQLAHEAGVVHRDLKPANVLVRESGDPVLCDFGIAYCATGRTVVTQEGVVLGSPATMAPEVILGAEPDPRADVFGLAATLFLLVYGEPVYGSDRPGAVVDRIQSGREPRIPEAFEGQSTTLEAALLEALRFDPDRRTPSAAAFAAAIAGDSPAPSREAPTRVLPGAVEPKHARPGASRRPLALQLGWAAALFTLMVWASWSLLAPVSPPPATDPVSHPDGGILVSETAERAGKLRAEVEELILELGVDLGKSESHPLAWAYREHFLDPRLPLRLRRILDELEELVRSEGRDALDPEEEVLLVRSVYLWLVPRIIRGLRQISAPRLTGHIEPKGIEWVSRATRSEDLLVKELRAGSDLVLADPPPGILLEAVVLMRTFIRAETLLEDLPKVLARHDLGPDAVLRVQRARLVALAASHASHSEAVYREAEPALLGALDVFRNRLPELDQALRLAVVGEAWSVLMRVFAIDPDRVSWRLLERVAGLSAQLPPDGSLFHPVGLARMEELRGVLRDRSGSEEQTRTVARLWWFLARERALLGIEASHVGRSPSRSLAPGTDQELDEALDRAMDASRAPGSEPREVLGGWRHLLRMLLHRRLPSGDLEVEPAFLLRLLEEVEGTWRRLLSGGLDATAARELSEDLREVQWRFLRPFAELRLRSLTVLLVLTRAVRGSLHSWAHRGIRILSSADLGPEEKALLERVSSTIVAAPVHWEGKECLYAAARVRAFRDPFQDSDLGFFRDLVSGQVDSRAQLLTQCLRRCDPEQCLDDPERANQELSEARSKLDQEFRPRLCEAFVRMERATRETASPFVKRWTLELRKICEEGDDGR